jgi:hypothetical protein
MQEYKITLWSGQVYYHKAKNIFAMIHIADKLYQCDYEITNN